MLCPKSVLITGANRGIGLEFVKAFISLQTPPEYIFACCRQPDIAEELGVIAKSNSTVHVLELDVTNQNTIVKTKREVETIVEGRGLNLLINNAAIYNAVRLEEVTREHMVKAYGTNTIGPLMMAQTFLPLLKLASSLNDSAPLSCSRAAIINMSSGVASISENSSGGMYPHRCSKAALNMLTSNLSLDLKDDGILCTAISPGWVKTDMGGANALITTETSMQGIMGILEKLHGEECSGKFYHAVRGDVMGW